MGIQNQTPSCGMEHKRLRNPLLCTIFCLKSAALPAVLKSTRQKKAGCLIGLNVFEQTNIEKEQGMMKC